MGIELFTEEDTQAPIDRPLLAPVTQAHATALPWPETAIEPVQIRWRYVIGIPLVHLLACLAFVPWLFSWAGVASAVLGLYVFGTFGHQLVLPPPAGSPRFRRPKMA
jgi:hypothetical protein